MNINKFEITKSQWFLALNNGVLLIKIESLNIFWGRPLVSNNGVWYPSLPLNCSQPQLHNKITREAWKMLMPGPHSQTFRFNWSGVWPGYGHFFKTPQVIIMYFQSWEPWLYYNHSLITFGYFFKVRALYFNILTLGLYSSEEGSSDQLTSNSKSWPLSLRFLYFSWQLP